ncbi:MAG: NAD(+) synthase [Deltaproteobacteria bacterium]|nr:MAG: NAD(+) synthase [Deltaproteobacteria bacterium]
MALANYEHGALRGEMTSETTSFEEDICEALSLGVRDYLTKCGYAKVIVGLSGGIDSAVVAALAVQALGPSKVQGVAMPSRYSSPGSLTDAQALAEGLGIRLDTVSIEPMYAAALGALQTPFAGMAADLTEENLQARLRGLVLMAFSNKLGALVLSTGNKSEIAVGYTTLYGDMCGGLSPLSDLYKGQVYALGRYLNGALPRPAIPASTFDKPPSAELRPDQRDDDSLPPYPTLDAVLHSMLEEGLSPAELRARGFDPALLARVANLLQRSEHKRRQMAPGLRLSTKAFGEGRRLPIAQRYVFV